MKLKCGVYQKSHHDEAVSVSIMDNLELNQISEGYSVPRPWFT